MATENTGIFYAYLLSITSVHRLG